MNKNFSLPTTLHNPTSASKRLHSNVENVENVGSKKENKSHPHALVSRIERYKQLLCRVVDHQLLGHLGEWLLHAYLMQQGWERVAFASEKRRGDVSGVHPKSGETIRFEVKTARQGIGRGHWQFCLNKSKKTASSHSDYLFMLAIDKHGAIYSYLVPSAFFGQTTQFLITSHPTSYRGKLAVFRLRSEAIDIYQANEIYQLGAKP